MVRRFIKEHSSLLLSIATGAGVITTAYLAAQAGYRTASRLAPQELYFEENFTPKDRLKEKARVVWKLYIPTGISAATTIVCVAGSKRVGDRKALALQTALTISQRAYESYRDQVIEELGDKKDQLFLSKVAEKQITNKPPPAIVAGSGTVLCCELFTGRYFNSDMDSLNKAVNTINAKLNRHDYATLDDFYYLIGLETTMVSGQTGWDSERLLELELSSILHGDKPCLAFAYKHVKTL